MVLALMVCIVLIFFFKQKTAYEMRISDWSSDVCSSDLSGARIITRMAPKMPKGLLRLSPKNRPKLASMGIAPAMVAVIVIVRVSQIGRASCRERVCQYV